MKYHDKVRGLRFAEIGKKRPRVVEVVSDKLYHVNTKVVDGPGKGNPLQVFRKQLIDPTRWVEVQKEKP